jgi:hypothetical protein
MVLSGVLRKGSARGLVLLAMFGVACGDSPTSPSGVSEGVSWTVNGESFRASSNGMAALRVSGTLSLTGADCGRGPIIGMFIAGANMSAPGTYSVGNGAGFSTVTWTPDARSGASAGEAWTAPGIPRVVNGVLVGGGSGSVTVSSITNDWVSGSFTFEVVANPGNQDGGNKSIQGTFELSFRERTVC